MAALTKGATVQYISQRLRQRAATIGGHDRTLMMEAAVVIEGRDQSLHQISIRAEIADADRRAGEALRRLESSEHENRMHRIWTDEAKRAAGFHTNTSFDDVWAEALAALIEKRKT